MPLHYFTICKNTTHCVSNRISSTWPAIIDVISVIPYTQLVCSPDIRTVCMIHYVLG